MALVDDLRRITGVGSAEYTIDAVAYWTDAQLAELLVGRELWHRRVPLQVHVNADGTITSADVHRPGVFEPGVDQGEILDSAGAPLTGWEINQQGRITFPADVSATRPVEFTGATYDLNAAAADALDGWAAAVQLGYDVSVDGQSMSRAQRHQHLVRQAKRHRARSLPRTIPARMGA